MKGQTRNGLGAAELWFLGRSLQYFRTARATNYHCLATATESRRCPEEMSLGVEKGEEEAIRRRKEREELVREE